MIESVPIFTGETDEECALWSEVQAALEKIKEVRPCNQADAIAKFLTRLAGLAKLCISELGKGSKIKLIIFAEFSAKGYPPFPPSRKIINISAIFRMSRWGEEGG